MDKSNTRIIVCPCCGEKIACNEVNGVTRGVCTSVGAEFKYVRTSRREAIIVLYYPKKIKSNLDDEDVS